MAKLWKIPWPGERWALAVQQHGRRLDPRFRFPGYDVRQFGRSDRAVRERLPDGGLRFAVVPTLGREFVVISGSIAPGLAPPGSTRTTPGSL